MFDLSPLFNDDRLRGMYTDHRDNVRWNIDGLFCDDRHDEGPPHGYLQLFRTGIIEAVEGWFIRPRQIAGVARTVILGYPFEKILGDDTLRLLGLQRNVGVALPIVALVASGSRGLGHPGTPTTTTLGGREASRGRDRPGHPAAPRHHLRLVRR